jgi:hypothetical protein
VEFVNTPVDGVVAPIVVPLIVPPVIVAFVVVNAFAFTVNALNVVPDAVAKPNQFVDVTFEKIAAAADDSPIVVLFIVPPVIVTFGEAKLDAFTVSASSVVPDAVTNPNQPVDVPFKNESAEEESEVNVALEAFTVVPDAVAKPNQLVDVAFVEVVFTASNPDHRADDEPRLLTLSADGNTFDANVATPEVSCVPATVTFPCRDTVNTSEPLNALIK